MMEVAWTRRFGRPPRDFRDYPILTLQALLFHWEDTAAEIERLSRGHRVHWLERATPATTRRARVSGPPGRGRKLRYDDVVLTGDPLADKWEEQIARGEIPDLEAR